MHVLAALDVNVQNDFWSIAAAIATMVAAGGTLAAVGAALFLPGWRAKRTRPKLTLSAEFPQWQQLYDAKDVNPVVMDGPQILLANEPGRETARGVEVLASVYEQPRGVGPNGEKFGAITQFIDVPLNHNANDGAYGRPYTNIGPGATRRVYFARIGEPEHIYDSWYRAPTESTVAFDLDWCGAWATYPARRDELHWIETGVEYIVELLVTGDNFDAFRVRGLIQFERSDWSEEPIGTEAAHPIFTRITWTETLEKVTDHIEPVM
jgi:hypothetical protein